MKPTLKPPYFLSEDTLNLDVSSDEFHVKAVSEICETAFTYAAKLAGPNSLECEEAYDAMCGKLEGLVLEFIVLSERNK